jgi:GNAT superfamily N-acetyltransferase
MISFAPASAADFERLLDLRILVMREHLERIGRFHPERARQRFRAGFQPAHMRLILVDGVFAGCVTLKPQDGHLEIEHFYLTPEHQGRGAGGEAIRQLLAEADGRALPVRLGVLKQSPAARFYERHGFVRTGEDEWDIYYERPVSEAHELVLTDAPDDASKKVINDGLTEYNREQAGYADYRPLAVMARDSNGATVGGMVGRTSLGLLFIDTVYLPKRLRGRDLGSRMLAMMEEEGRRRGCTAGVLYTISFQAPGFYARRGWREFGRVPCEPPGTHRVFMTKTLV